MASTEFNSKEYSHALYETYLSKAIIEFREGYESLFIKIAKAMQSVLLKNKSNPALDRRVFSAFSALSQEFPGYTYIEQLTVSNFNLYAATSFHKVFFEHLAKHISFDPQYATNSLSALTRTRIVNCPELLSELRTRLDSAHAFDDNKTGREELDDESSIKQTRKLGITSEQQTLSDIKTYFNQFYIPAQNRFKRDNTSKVSSWLNSHHLPFVAGVSGTIGTCYCGLIQLLTLSSDELKTYLMVVTASLVARGHHSFGEVHPILSKLGMPIKILSDQDAYYAQFLTAEFKESSQYQNFLIEIEKIEAQHVQGMKQ